MVVWTFAIYYKQCRPAKAQLIEPVIKQSYARSPVSSRPYKQL